MSNRVLCLMADGFEEIEAVTPIDLLRRAGIEVVMASLRGGVVTGRCGIRIETDAVLAEVMPETFDLLMIPGGAAIGELRSDGRAALLAHAFVEAGKMVSAICAGPLVLKDAGLLAGRRFTAHSAVYNELPECLSARVVIDGNLITSRGAGTALDFGLAMVERLSGKLVAERVAAEILV